MPPLWGPRRSIAVTFGAEKIQWCGYRTVKIFEDMFIRFDRIHKVYNCTMVIEVSQCSNSLQLARYSLNIRLVGCNEI